MSRVSIYLSAFASRLSAVLPLPSAATLDLALVTGGDRLVRSVLTSAALRQSMSLSISESARKSPMDIPALQLNFMFTHRHAMRSFDENGFVMRWLSLTGKF